MAVQESEVLREFPAIARYRVRIVRRGNALAAVDVREHIASDSFTGFTRKGIVLSSRSEVERLHAVLTEVLASGEFAEKPSAAPTRE